MRLFRNNFLAVQAQQTAAPTSSAFKILFLVKWTGYWHMTASQLEKTKVRHHGQLALPQPNICE